MFESDVELLKPKSLSGGVRLFMTVGLPASGKSTWAREMVAAHGVKRVNKDDLRAMLDSSKHSKANEKMVLAARDMLVSSALTAGCSVVVDDTNLHPKHAEALSVLAADHNAELVVVSFTHVPLRVCLERDAARENPVGAKAIRSMARQFLSTPPRMVQDSTLPAAIIVDLDGTLAELTGTRSVYDASRCGEDTLNPAVSALVWSMQSGPFECKVIACTGRGAEHEGVTRDWLAAHGIDVDMLLMRPVGDKRSDVVVKRELFDTQVANRFRVLFVLEDRDRVVDMWRDAGLDCFQVTEER